jgi:hypothetical protein
MVPAGQHLRVTAQKRAPSRLAAFTVRRAAVLRGSPDYVGLAPQDDGRSTNHGGPAPQDDGATEAPADDERIGNLPRR